MGMSASQEPRDAQVEEARDRGAEESRTKLARAGYFNNVIIRRRD